MERDCLTCDEFCHQTDKCKIEGERISDEIPYCDLWYNGKAFEFKKEDKK